MLSLPDLCTQITTINSTFIVTARDGTHCASAAREYYLSTGSVARHVRLQHCNIATLQVGRITQHT
eukprot:m.1238468 g.1238468  ORF g.1238468 m.1238468 type:complete len:66 (+) comp24671_c2_seq1:79-276(+)